MYAIHIRQNVLGAGLCRLDIQDVVKELAAAHDCVLEHIYAPRTNENGHSGVLYVTGESVNAAGAGVLDAVRRAISGTRMWADLAISGDPWSVGMCDATIRVAPLRMVRTAVDPA
ncbi:hypothetical protein [Streptomyces sp. NPDC060198]|uniref:hypothetical protein n=1 Tax=Streptomyces sp. NPDC060198 TaxID=3347070 RepID=UPI0036545CE9